MKAGFGMLSIVGARQGAQGEQYPVSERWNLWRNGGMARHWASQAFEHHAPLWRTHHRSG